jgi:hypothetical protein
VQKRKGRGGRAGPAGCEIGPLGPTACARKKKRPLAWVACGLKGCWAGGRKKKREGEGEGEGNGFSFFFKKILFKFIFQTFKLQPNKIHAFKS